MYLPDRLINYAIMVAKENDGVIIKYVGMVGATRAVITKTYSKSARIKGMLITPTTMVTVDEVYNMKFLRLFHKEVEFGNIGGYDDIKDLDIK